jgi:hypothetical protein
MFNLNKGATMRNSEKVKKDQERGLMVKKMRSAAKYSPNTAINNAILRAARRNRISPDTANRCLQTWNKELAARPASVMWNLYAASQLLEVAKRRKQGNLASAKIVLCDAKVAIRTARIALS